MSDMVFPSGNKDSVVEVFYLEGHNAFIVGANGHITIEMIKMIEKDFADNQDEGFESGEGSYLFKVTYDSGMFDKMAKCEMSPYWQLDQIDFKPIPSH